MSSSSETSTREVHHANGAQSPGESSPTAAVQELGSAVESYVTFQLECQRPHVGPLPTASAQSLHWGSGWHLQLVCVQVSWLGPSSNLRASLQACFSSYLLLLLTRLPGSPLPDGPLYFAWTLSPAPAFRSHGAEWRWERHRLCHPRRPAHPSLQSHPALAASGETPAIMGDSMNIRTSLNC